ncbi:MAG: hypothetical protein A2W31_15675 [Planctomycetes bacterium RBG_16_64_10]|nr:MAG: hypothetical protein A2W31_15675 [Planctomycetes bacterium RBG_16_64_10]
MTDRLRALDDRRGLAQAFAVVETPSPALERFAAQHPAGYCPYPDLEERVAFWDAHLRRTTEVCDDGVPAVYLSECDQGLYGGLVGGRVEYMAHPENGWISSMVEPVLADWSEFSGLSVDPQAVAFDRFRTQLDTFCRAGQGKFGISHFILIDGLNFIFELLGATRTYLALVDEPDLVRQAIDLAFELNVLVQNTFFDASVLVDGGTCSNMVQWIPGRIVSESVDPFHMTSVAVFEQWGRAPVERILAEYDGGVVHIHGNGRHLLEAVATIKGLRAVLLADDVGFPRAFDILPAVRRRVGDLPLVVFCRWEEITAALDHGGLTGGVLYRVQGVPDPDTANRLMDRIRACRC